MLKLFGTTRLLPPQPPPHTLSLVQETANVTAKLVKQKPNTEIIVALISAFTSLG